MPIYEYTCRKCGHEFEVIQGKDAGNPCCVKCESKETEKRIARKLGKAGSCAPAGKKSPFS